MTNDNINEILLKNVSILSRHSEKEDSMMPKGNAPLPSVESVRNIVTLVKSIISATISTNDNHRRKSVPIISV